MADVGIIGYPNAGKSTLLRNISQAKPKTADYPFTTLTPQLGMVSLGGERSFAVADIPGIIEGAHRGSGLGIQFLKHIERTKVLIHLLDLDPHTGRDPVMDYAKLNDELSSYSPTLAEKPQVVAANKTDLPGTEERLDHLTKYLDVDFFPISAILGKGVRELLNEAYHVLTRMRETEHPL
jgi:GTP-binding protein